MMTKIKITNVPGYCHIRIEGHAGYGFANLLPEGNDIVCAAISVLGQTAAQCIMDMSEAGKVGIKEMTIKDALIDIKAIPKQIHKSELDIMVKTIKAGYELLAKAHPAYISLGWETTFLYSGNIDIIKKTHRKDCARHAGETVRDTQERLCRTPGKDR